MRKILVADDLPRIRDLLEIIIREFIHCDVVAVATGEAAIERYAAERFDIVLVDWNFGNGLNGGQVLWKLREIDPQAKVVLITAYVEEHTSITEIAKTKFDKILYKPFSVQEVNTAIRSVLPTPKEELLNTANEVLDTMSELSRRNKKQNSCRFLEDLEKAGLAIK